MQFPLWRAALGLAGLVLILFLVAGIVLWFEFKISIILIHTDVYLLLSSLH